MFVSTAPVSWSLRRRSAAAESPSDRLQTGEARSPEKWATCFFEVRRAGAEATQCLWPADRGAQFGPGVAHIPEPKTLNSLELSRSRKHRPDQMSRWRD